MIPRILLQHHWDLQLRRLSIQSFILTAWVFIAHSFLPYHLPITQYMYGMPVGEEIMVSRLRAGIHIHPLTHSITSIPRTTVQSSVSHPQSFFATELVRSAVEMVEEIDLKLTSHAIPVARE